MTTASIDATSDGGFVRLAVHGEVDLSNAEDVERAIGAAVSNEAHAVAIDLGAVDYLDSAGLRMLYALAARLDVLQIRFEVIAPAASIARHAIELTGLGDVVHLVAAPTPQPAPGTPGASGAPGMPGAN